jgi:hypothetical protein
VSATDKSNRPGLASAKGNLGEQAAKAIEAVKTAASGAREEARNLVSDAKSKAEEVLSRQKDAASDQISGFARILRTAADQLQEHEDGAMAGYATQAADALDRTSRALEERDLGGLMHDVEDLGRRQPLLLFGGAMLTGFLLARFLRSSGSAGASQSGARISDAGRQEARHAART